MHVFLLHSKFTTAQCIPVLARKDSFAVLTHNVSSTSRFCHQVECGMSDTHTRARYLTFPSAYPSNFAGISKGNAASRMQYPPTEVPFLLPDLAEPEATSEQFFHLSFEQKLAHFGFFFFFLSSQSSTLKGERNYSRA